jgi:hypothetical protein
MNEWMNEKMEESGVGGGMSQPFEPLMNELVLINSGRTFTLNWD